MDSNQTRFHLVFGEADWRRSSAPGGGPFEKQSLEWDAERAELRLRRERIEFVAPPQDTPPDPGDPASTPPRPSRRRGAAQDRYGNVYGIQGPPNAPNAVRIRSRGTGKVSVFWPVENPVAAAKADTATSPFQPASDPAPVASWDLSGLAVTRDHFLVVGSVAPAGVLVFDLHAGSQPRWVRGPLGFETFDLAAGPDGRVWMLDRKNQAYWGLERIGVPVDPYHERFPSPGLRPPSPRTAGRGQGEGLPSVSVGSATGPAGAFHPVTGPAVADCLEPELPVGISLTAAGGDVLALEALADGVVIFLVDDRAAGVGRLHARRAGKPWRVELVSGEEGGTAPTSVHRAYDMAFVADASDPRSGRLWLAGAEGNQAFAYRVEVLADGVRLTPERDFYPMRRFSGGGLVRGGDSVLYDSEDRWVPLLAQARQRFAASGVLWTGVMDGREPGCVWHRLLLDAVLPDGARLTVRSRAAEDWNPSDPTDPLPGAVWREEPIPIRRRGGSELPFLREDPGSPYDTFELLFQKATGRYLQVELTLAGDRKATPRLRALRCYYPRFSYLEKNLPAVYREQPESASFLDRFLANFEGIHTALEDRIAEVQALFDPRTTPADTLAWLASWFGVALDPAWDEKRQRLFLRHAMEFFQWRGTIRGLEMALHLAFDEDPGDGIFEAAASGRSPARRVRIAERFRARSIPLGALARRADEAVAGEGATALWRPSDTRDALHRRYREFLGIPGSTLRYVLISPARDVEFWRHFLQQRYGGDITSVREAHEGAWTDFGAVPLPSLSGSNDALYRDWVEYVRWAEGTKTAFARGVLGFVPTPVTSDLDRWQSYLMERYDGVIQALRTAHSVEYPDFAAVPIPGSLVAHARRTADWKDFVEEMGLQGAEELGLWHRFLAGRYPSLEALQAEYGEAYAGVVQVPLPAQPPPDGGRLEDWYRFQAVVLPMHRSAHRFSVLLPAGLEELRDPAGRERALELARRLVELEKPAHTVFDVRFFWDFFRVGEARLGEETHLAGAEREEFVRPTVLGREFLAATYPARAPLVSRLGRHVLGEQSLGFRSHL